MSWCDAPLKRVAGVRFSSVDKTTIAGERPVRLCNYTDVYYRARITPDQDFMRATASDAQIRDFRLASGDTLLTKDSETADDIGVPAFVERSADDLLCGYHLAVVRPVAVDPRYLFWVLSSRPFRDQLTTAATGVTRFGLRAESLGSATVRVGSAPEQRAIADFLDTETARIDALIAKKRRLAGLMTDRVAAEREHLLTSPGRATGIPSLPTVPSDWRLLRNKVFLRDVNDPSSDGTEEMLSVSHLTGVTPRSEKTVYMFEAENTVGYKRVRPGDLVINTMWAWMGAAGVSAHYGIVSPAYGVYRFTSDQVDPDYYDVLIRAPGYIEEMTRFSRGVTSSRLRLYADEFLCLRAPIPPINQQRYIAAAHRRSRRGSERLRAALTQQIDLLLEHRQALITAAVTGELDVAQVS